MSTHDIRMKYTGDSDLKMTLIFSIIDTISSQYSPLSGSNLPPFSMLFRNVDGLRLKLPSASVGNLFTSDCAVVSRDIASS